MRGPTQTPALLTFNGVPASEVTRVLVESSRLSLKRTPVSGFCRFLFSTVVNPHVYISRLISFMKIHIVFTSNDFGVFNISPKNKHNVPSLSHDESSNDNKVVALAFCHNSDSQALSSTYHKPTPFKSPLFR